jgi:hypothetical protein
MVVPGQPSKFSLFYALLPQSNLTSGTILTLHLGLVKRKNKEFWKKWKIYPKKNDKLNPNMVQFADNRAMGSKQKSVRWEPWIENAINALANEKGKTFSWMANFLVGMKLNDLDIAREDFEPGMEDIALKVKNKKAAEAKKGKRVQSEGQASTG